MNKTQAKKKDRFVVWMHVQPQVKKWLIQNYGVYDEDWPDLVNVSKDKELSLFLDSSLKKPSRRWDNKFEKTRIRTCMVALEISADKFYRYGWTVSPTDEVRFNKAVNIKCCTLAIVIINYVYGLTGSFATALRYFRRISNFTEDDWPTDTIRKKWLRCKNKPNLKLRDDFFNRNCDFFLENLSKTGTISHQGLEKYENNTTNS